MRKGRAKNTTSRQNQPEREPVAGSSKSSSAATATRASENLIAWPGQSSNETELFLNAPSGSSSQLGSGDMGGGLELSPSGIPDYTSSDVLDLFRRFIDLPSEDESDDPDFRPQDAGEEDEWVAESDTASGDEEVVVAHSMTTMADQHTSPDFDGPGALHLDLDDPFWRIPQSNHTPMPTDTSLLPFSSNQSVGHSSPDIPASHVLPQPHRQQQAADSYKDQSSAKDTPVETEQPVKRGRGRPRKHPKPEEKPGEVKQPPAKQRKTIAPEDRRQAKLERNRAGVQRRKNKALEDAQRLAQLEFENAALKQRNAALEQHLATFGISIPLAPVTSEESSLSTPAPSFSTPFDSLENIPV